MGGKIIQRKEDIKTGGVGGGAGSQGETGQNVNSSEIVNK